MIPQEKGGTRRLVPPYHGGQDFVMKRRDVGWSILFCWLGIVCVRADDKSAREDHKFTNKLAHEISPYLLQHAHNPANGDSWGPQAFAKDKKQGKPGLISIA